MSGGLTSVSPWTNALDLSTSGGPAIHEQPNGLQNYKSDSKHG